MIRAFCFVIIIGVLTSCQNKELLQEGVSLELAEYRKGLYSNIHYDLDLDLTKSLEAPVSGIMTLKFDHLSPDENVILDFRGNAENIKNIYFKNESVKWRIKNSHIIITPPNEATETQEYRIHYTADPEALHSKTGLVYTLFVPDKASRLMPCFDQPDLKAAFELTLTIPKSWKAVSNGSEISRECTDKSCKVRFEPTKPISTYLMAFAAGAFKTETRPLDSLRTATMFYILEDEATVAQNLDAIFDLHTTSLKWLETYTTIDYPFEKFDWVLIPSFQYGGMEHPGSIFYNAERLMLPANPSFTQLQGRANLIAHETAHMWFGDLVTMKWFDDVWLKEVFANFLAAKIVNPMFPDTDHALRFFLSHHISAYEVDRTRGTHSIRQELPNLIDAGNLYGPIIYQKAPVAMNQLELALGAEKFQEALIEYLQTYAHGNATWDDLVSILDTYSEDINLVFWSNMWIKNAGMPSFFIKDISGESGKQFELFQFNNDNPSNWWPQTFNVAVGTKDTIVEVPVNLRSRRSDILKLDSLEGFLYLVSNANGAGYGYFQMGQGSMDYLSKNLYTLGKPIYRGMVMAHLWEAVLNKRFSLTAYFDLLLEGANAETEPVVLEYCLGRIETIFNRIMTDSQRMARSAGLESVLIHNLTQRQDPGIRASFYKTLRRVAIGDNGIKVLEGVLKNEIEVGDFEFSEEDRLKAGFIIALHRGEEGLQLLDQLKDELKDEHKKERLEYMKMALSPDPELRKSFFYALEDHRNRKQEAWVLEALGYLHHPMRQDASREFIGPSIEWLPDIQRTNDIFFPKRWIETTLMQYSDPEAGDTVREFLYRNPRFPAHLKRILLESSDLMFRVEGLHAKDGDLQ